MSHSPLIKATLVFFLSVCSGVMVQTNAFAEQGTPHPIDVDVVHQIIDAKAETTFEAFRFEPDYLRIKPGTTIRFKGSTGRHTVSSVRGMYPDQAKPFEIRGKPEMGILFEQEGVYGIRCRVHGRHGMAMLVVVGDPSTNLDTARVQKVGKKEKIKFKRLFDRLDGEIAKGVFQDK